MPEVVYRGLEAVGVPLIGKEEESFAVRLRTIRTNSWFPVPEVQDEPAAILVNLSGQTILAFAANWEYSDAQGMIQRKTVYALNSSNQWEALRGRGGIVPHDNSIILPGSQRLILEERICGDNQDVVPPEMGMSGRSFGGGGRRVSPHSGREPDRVELSLDAVILDDGRMVGPDESGFLDGVVRTLAEELELAERMLEALRRDGTPGALLDLMRPLARVEHRVPPRMYSSHHMFFHRAMHVLLHESEEEIRRWVEQEASPPRLQLRRAVI